MSDFADALEVRRRVRDRLLNIPGVVGVGFGAKVAGGLPTGEISIRVHVLRKRPLSELNPAEVIPPEIDGVKTDVVEHVDSELRTLLGGAAIYTPHATRGTLGCFAKTTDASLRNVLLTNHHVLYGLPPTIEGKTGDPITVDSCSGCCTDKIGSVLSGHNTGIDRAQHPPMVDAPTYDAATGGLEPGADWRAWVHDNPVTGSLDLLDGANLPADVQTALANRTYRVHKYGSTSGFSEGVVIDIHAPATVADDKNQTIVSHIDQIQINPVNADDFSAAGDSGSVILNEKGQVLGLLWGGIAKERKDASGKLIPNPAPRHSTASHITVIETALGIAVATNPPTGSHVVPSPSASGALPPRVARELTGYPAGKRLLQLYERHEREVRLLLRSSRPVIVAWHRNGGPAAIRSLVRVVEQPEAVVPTTLGEKTWQEAVAAIAAVLISYASDELKADLEQFAPMLGQLQGRSYAEARGLLSRVGYSHQ